MNVKLLRKVQEHIIEEPKRFVMRTFLARGDDYDGTPYAFLGDDSKEFKFAECNTAACIGGWAVLLSEGIKTEKGNIRGRAKAALELPKNFDEDRLFEVSRWPDRFQKRFRQARSQRGRAQAAVERIDHFIRTEGAE